MSYSFRWLGWLTHPYIHSSNHLSSHKGSGWTRAHPTWLWTSFGYGLHILIEIIKALLSFLFNSIRIYGCNSIGGHPSGNSFYCVPASEVIRLIRPSVWEIWCLSVPKIMQLCLLPSTKIEHARWEGGGKKTPPDVSIFFCLTTHYTTTGSSWTKEWK